MYEDPIAIATFATTEKGIFVSTSTRNQGPTLETLSNEAPWVIIVSVGALDHEFQGTLTLVNGVLVTGLSLYKGNFTSDKIPLVFHELV